MENINLTLLNDALPKSRNRFCNFVNPGPIPEDFSYVPGFVEDLVNWTLYQSHSPNRTLAFAGALAMLAHLSGRTFSDASGTRTNLYVIALAPSGSGKESPRSMNNLLAKRARTESSSTSRAGSRMASSSWRQMKWPEISAWEEYGPERTTVRLALPSLQQKEIKNVTGQQPKGHVQDMATAQAKRLGEKLGERLGERLGETRLRILDIIKEDSFIAIPKIAAIVGVSETAIQNNLAWLKAHGFVRRVGGARGGHWAVSLRW